MNRRDFLKSVTAVCAVGCQTPSLAVAEPSSSSRVVPRLPRRPLGKTGLEVSALALGGVIGMQLPPSVDHDPVVLAETALDLGITYFDTAPAYNNGQSESNYGQVLARRRKEVFLATKTGDRTHDGTLRSIEQSLKRLRTDRGGNAGFLARTPGLLRLRGFRALGAEHGQDRRLGRHRRARPRQFLPQPD